MKRLLALLLAVAMILSAAGCVRGGQPGGEDDPKDTSQTQQTTDPTGFDSETPDPIDQYSSIDVDENGFWEGLVALDHVTMFEYKGIEIPNEVHTITAEQVKEAIEDVENPFSQAREPRYPEKYRNFQKAVEDGDRVNIDYIGSMQNEETNEWEEFEGGNSFIGPYGEPSTDGALVTAGTPAFIDDFLWQIIGMKPGETKDIFVHFPDEYPQNPAFEGREAKFIVTINFTVEVEDYWFNELKRIAVRKYIENDFFINDVVATVPEFFLEMTFKSTVTHHEQEASYYGMTMSYYISDGLQIEGGMEAFLAEMRKESETVARARLIYQAIAEEMKLDFSEKEVFDFLDEVGFEDYEAVEEFYGMPFLKQVAMQDYIVNYIIDNAVYL